MDFKKQNIIEFLNIALQTTPGQGCGEQTQKANKLPKSFLGLDVKPGVGMGRATAIPWITFTGYNQRTSNGIYPVILFYHEKNILIVAYGISATNEPVESWNLPELKTIGQYFEEQNIPQTNIEKKFNGSFVHSVYPVYVDNNRVVESKFDVDAVFKSISDLCVKYKNKFENKNSPAGYNEDDSPQQTLNEEYTPIPEIPITVKLSDLAASANATLPDALLDAIKQISPQSFEVLIKKLLVAMGYGNTTDDVIVTRYVGDNGIDGYVRKDRLDIEKLCAYQAKRYTNSKVGIAEMNELGGSMINCGTNCGIFVTTTDFTSSAKSYNPRGYTIICIDGKSLVGYLIEYGIGVKTKRIEVKTVDYDFLNSL